VQPSFHDVPTPPMVPLVWEGRVPALPLLPTVIAGLEMDRPAADAECRSSSHDRFASL